MKYITYYTLYANKSLKVCLNCVEVKFLDNRQTIRENKYYKRRIYL